MIDCFILDKAAALGGAGSWSLVKDSMSPGQDFYTTDIGKITFINFITNENGSDVPIFRTNRGLSSYEYFYRELLCGDSVFICQEKAKEMVVINKIKRLKFEFDNDPLFALMVMQEVCGNISVELNPVNESEHTKTLSVKDLFIGDNGECLISVDDFEVGS